jgi:hypothetical protein
VGKHDDTVGLCIPLVVVVVLSEGDCIFLFFVLLFLDVVDVVVMILSSYAHSTPLTHTPFFCTWRSIAQHSHSNGKQNPDSHGVHEREKLAVVNARRGTWKIHSFNAF